MLTLLLHFVIATSGALVIFLVAARVSGEGFSAPFGVVFVGVSCASLAHFLSPWATPVVLALYAAASLAEAVRSRRSGASDGGRPPES